MPTVRRYSLVSDDGENTFVDYRYNSSMSYCKLITNIVSFDDEIYNEFTIGSSCPISNENRIVVADPDDDDSCCGWSECSSITDVTMDFEDNIVNEYSSKNRFINSTIQVHPDMYMPNDGSKHNCAPPRLPQRRHSIYLEHDEIVSSHDDTKNEPHQITRIDDAIVSCTRKDTLSSVQRQKNEKMEVASLLVSDMYQIQMIHLPQVLLVRLNDRNIAVKQSNNNKKMMKTNHCHNKRKNPSRTGCAMTNKISNTNSIRLLKQGLKMSRQRSE